MGFGIVGKLLIQVLFGLLQQREHRRPLAAVVVRACTLDELTQVVGHFGGTLCLGGSTLALP